MNQAKYIFKTTSLNEKHIFFVNIAKLPQPVKLERESNIKIITKFGCLLARKDFSVNSNKEEE